MYDIWLWVDVPTWIDFSFDLICQRLTCSTRTNLNTETFKFLFRFLPMIPWQPTEVDPGFFQLVRISRKSYSYQFYNYIHIVFSFIIIRSSLFLEIEMDLHKLLFFFIWLSNYRILINGSFFFYLDILQMTVNVFTIILSP